MILSAVSYRTTAGRPGAEDCCVRFFRRGWLACEEAMAISVMRHQRGRLEFRRATGHAFTVSDVEETHRILWM